MASISDKRVWPLQQCWHDMQIYVLIIIRRHWRIIIKRMRISITVNGLVRLFVIMYIRNIISIFAMHFKYALEAKHARVDWCRAWAARRWDVGWRFSLWRVQQAFHHKSRHSIWTVSWSSGQPQRDQDTRWQQLHVGGQYAMSRLITCTHTHHDCLCSCDVATSARIACLLEKNV